jgi:hypothetical protein
MSYAANYLLDIGAHNGSAPITLRFGTVGYITGPNDTPANTPYEERVMNIDPYVVHLFEQNKTMGEMSITPGSVELANPDGALDYMKDLAFDGRPFVMRRLETPWSSYATAEIVLTGTIEGMDSDDSLTKLRLRFYDRRRDIDIPLQKNKYTGTTTSGVAGGADGTPDQKGVLKPVLYGTNLAVPGVLVDPFNLIIQVNDGPVSQIIARDGGIPLIFDADFPSLAALQSATGNPGHYATCRALGLWKPFGSFQGRPGFIWTADVTEGATPQSRRAGAICLRILSRIGITGGANVNEASFLALDDAVTIEHGFYTEDEMSGLTAVRQILGSIGASIVPNSFGQFEAVRVIEPVTPIFEIIEPEIITSNSSLPFFFNPDTDGNVPAYEVKVFYARLNHTFSNSEIGPSFADSFPEQAERLKQEWLEATQESQETLDLHPLSKGLEIQTTIAGETAANAESSRFFALYSVNRQSLTVGVTFEDAKQLNLGDTVAVIIPRLGYDAGKPMLIIGRSDNWVEQTVQLTLWG